MFVALTGGNGRLLTNVRLVFKRPFGTQTDVWDPNRRLETKRAFGL